jgi:hypothetical protein
MGPSADSSRVLQGNEIRLSWDGNQICALVGPDLVAGVAGFGGSVHDALRELRTTSFGRESGSKSRTARSGMSEKSAMTRRSRYCTGSFTETHSLRPRVPCTSPCLLLGACPTRPCTHGDAGLMFRALYRPFLGQRNTTMSLLDCRVVAQGCVGGRTAL